MTYSPKKDDLKPSTPNSTSPSAEDRLREQEACTESFRAFFEEHARAVENCHTQEQLNRLTSESDDAVFTRCTNR